MERVNILQHNGKDIICLDFSNYNIKDKKELILCIGKAKELVSKQPPKSALIITNVTNTGFDSELTAIFKDYARHNTPYVKASTIVGVSGLQKIILSAVKALTGRDYYLADNMEQAKDWLIAQ